MLCLVETEYSQIVSIIYLENRYLSCNVILYVSNIHNVRTMYRTFTRTRIRILIVAVCFRFSANVTT